MVSWTALFYFYVRFHPDFHSVEGPVLIHSGMDSACPFLTHTMPWGSWNSEVGLHTSWHPCGGELGRKWPSEAQSSPGSRPLPRCTYTCLTRSLVLKLGAWPLIWFWRTKEPWLSVFIWPSGLEHALLSLEPSSKAHEKTNLYSSFSFQLVFSTGTSSLSTWYVVIAFCSTHL